MDLSVEIRQLFKQQQGYSHWRNILHFYEEHKDNLTDKQKKRIINKSEKYRLEHNRDSKNHNDKIRKEDVYPNIYLSQIR
jgi:hypothetical protein